MHLMGKLKSFDIIFDSNQKVFYTGQIVKGKCVIELKSEIKCKSIKIHMKGIAKVHWSESSSSGNRMGSTKDYRAENLYFTLKKVLYGNGNFI